MNSDYKEGERGASIVPSARKSIHRYQNNNMGRYGLNKIKDKNNQTNSPGNMEQGTDEVDNVMSKMAHQISPITIRKKNIHRTNSYSKDEETSDNSSHVLSKSLPTTLPSHLYYSDETDCEEPNYSATSRLEDSDHSLLFNRSHQSSEHIQRSPSYHRRLSFSPPLTGTTKKQSNKFLFVIFVTSVIGIVAAYYPTILEFLPQSSHDKSTQTISQDQMLFENNMNTLQERYNIDGNTILQIKTGILTIFSRMDTGSFMFIYNSKTHNFNPSLFEKFINEVAYTAAKFLRNNISSIKQSIVLSSDLNMQEHSELINRYRDDVDKTGVLLVKEVDSVPSDLAMAFHYYCDEYNPLVKKSAIFFTLNLANCSSNVSDKKFTHDSIEKCLASKWKTVPPANIRPLLARVVDIVIDVTSAF